MRIWDLAIAAVCAAIWVGTATAQTPVLTVVSAASFSRDAVLAPDMIVTGFTEAIPGVTASADAPRLPTSLSGFSVVLRDSAGTDRLAELVSIARGQVSFLIPATIAQGPATVLVRRNEATAASASIRIGRTSPGIFTANSSGQGAPAGFALSVAGEGAQTIDHLYERIAGQSGLAPKPFDPAGGQVYLVLFGTGIRGAAASSVRAAIGNQPVPVQAAVAQGDFAGLDQVNLGPLPGSLAGRRGLAELTITVDGVPANPLTLAPTLPKAGGWGTRARLLEANSEMGVAELNAKIYVLGGYPSSRLTVATVQAYDTVSDTWERVAPLPVPVNHPMPAVTGGRLFVIGGQTDPNVAYTNAVQEYDPASNTWRMRAPMPTSRSAGAAVVIGGRIYVAGGRPPRGADFAVYDPARDEWTPLPDLPTQRNHLAAAAINGKVYVVGGRFEGGFQSPQADTVEFYDPQTDIWSKGAAMPKPRGGVNGVEALGCLHVWGGEFAAGVHSDHDVYNPVTDTWTSMPPLPVPVHGVTGAVFLDGLIYLAGGGTSQGGSSGSTHHQVYRPGIACR